MTLITPRRAAELYKMPGVNIHPGDGEYPSAINVANILKDLDIKRYRCGFPPGTASTINTLYTVAGAKCCLITNANESATRPSGIVATLKSVGVEKFDAVEQHNEPDGFGLNWGGQSFPGSVPLYAADLKTALNSDTATAGLIKVGTSVSYYNTSNVPSLSSYVDVTNCHPYPADQLPDETTQYGCWVQNYYDGAGRLHGYDKPNWITEDGYYKSVATTATDDGNRFPISEKAFAKYIARRMLFLFQNSIANVSQWYIYELRDMNGQTWNKESQFGIVDSAGNPKPAYYVLKNLIASVKDVASNALTFTTTPLDLTFSGDTANLETRLLQKANGDYVLALWRKLRSYQASNDPTLRKDLDYTATNVTVAINGATPNNINKLDLLTGITTPIGTTQSFSVPVADSVVIINLVTSTVTPPNSTSQGFFDMTLANIGSSASIAATYEMKAATGDIWGTSDKFEYEYKQGGTNCELIARVASIDDTNCPNCKAGIMIRETLDANSKHVLIVIHQKTRLYVEKRDATGGVTNVPSGEQAVTVGTYLKLSKVGNQITASRSPDGIAWTQFYTFTSNISNTCLIGLIAASNSGSPVTVRFDAVK